MKTITKLGLAVLLFLFTGLNVNAQVPSGTYMSFGSGSHHTITVTEETIKIEPCLKYESALSVANETYEFKKLDNTNNFGWKGYSDVILNYNKDTKEISFKEPVNMNNHRHFKFMHM
ncbi:hypothetical protein [Soonwooa sp.]|uniref:hypothetical protein n=1 Tax=Soonwooa sp. TaxID=1938592 RepID=UPI00289AA19D|nr:hypothetical protein [Soonwooa sp.]